MTVYLVGAGPGDPGLLTLRGAALLARCDLVVYDRLVDPRVLALASPAATRVDVGKRAGSSEMSQQEINTLLIGKGRDGVVVRLKGGDPYLFGRGGEEALALAEAGVDYEVVPGLSAALAVPAAAGIPVTLRGSASAVVILTGHDPDHLEGLDELARSGATLVVLMAGATSRRLAERLLAAGMAPSTPATATRFGTLPDQESLRTTLAGLTEVDLESPVTIVIGAVAAQRLASFEERPLAGLRVVVTRRVDQAGELVALLEEAGAAVTVFPTIKIAPPADGAVALTAALSRTGTFDWLVLSSENAVDAVFGAVHDARALAGMQLAVVGEATAAALAERGVIADLVPVQGGSAGLLSVFPEAASRMSVLIVHAAAGLDTLETGLVALGYDVDVVDAYQTVVPDPDDEALAALEGCDAVVFTSPSSVDGYLQLAGRDRLGSVAVSIGPTTSSRIVDLGVAMIEAVAPSPASIVAALIAWADASND